MDKKAATVDAWLASLPADQRKALQSLRKVLHSAAPGATELVNYGIPMLRLDGKNLVGFAAGKAHCSFYPMSMECLKHFKAETKGFKTATSTIRFQPDHPIPAALVKRIVKWRLAEMKASAATGAGKKAAKRTKDQ